MKISLTFTDSISGVANFVTGLEQSDFSFVRSDNHSTEVGFSYFQEIGDGQYEFGDFEAPEVTLNTGTGQWTDSVIVVLPRINGTIQEGFSEIPVWNDSYIPVSKGDLVVRADKLGDTILNWFTYDPSLSGVNGFNPFSIPNDAYRRFRIPSVGWVENAITGSNGAYLPITGGTINGSLTVNGSNLTLVQTNFNGFAASANLKKVSSSSMHIYNFLGTHPTGEHFTYGYVNTDAENVQVFSMGCGSDEIPYIDFHNRQILNFNANISMANYMPLTGGVFSGSVTANGPRFPLGNTQFGSKGTTGDFAMITVSSMTANARGIHIRSNLGIIGSGDMFSVFYTDTNPDTHFPFRVGADPATEFPYIVLDGSLSSNQFTSTAPSTNIAVAQSLYIGTTGSTLLAQPAKWLEINDSSGGTYLIPAYPKP